METINFTTGNIILDIILCGVLGIAFHVFVLKLPALKRRCDKANINFNPNDFFKNDWISLVASFLVVLIYLFVANELFSHAPILEPFKKALAVLVGYCGSSILLHALGNTEKKVLSIIDKKTDIADGKV